ncbi:hypothetical protein NC99_05250 [Sunxiuqinia dokdonensis]|uniref:Uncharacterized protein n=1 Tax=Sunxiuqinia dokdonensis TaxID=1409788 RepID=A0A0L8VDZ5_9BACT|nr:hypothetical protein NC99_05250 [Sunxiuqinia dokdonensis]
MCSFYTSPSLQVLLTKDSDLLFVDGFFRKKYLLNNRFYISKE